MKNLKQSLKEAMSNYTFKIQKGKKYVKKNELIDDKALKEAILNETISPEDAWVIFEQYDTDSDELEEAGYDDGYVDELACEYNNFRDYYEREYKGSVSGYIDEVLDLLGVDEWWWGLLVILNKNSD